MTAYLFDTETNGQPEPEIVQAAWKQLPAEARVPDEGESVPCFSRFYRPTAPNTFAALAVHHIMDEELALCEASREFHLPDDCTIIIGHNIDYDWKAIGSPRVRRICTLALARKLWPAVDSHAQGALLYYLEREHARDWLRHAHNANADVTNCGRILRRILSELPGVTTWADLWRESEAARIPSVMPFGKHKGTAIAALPRDYREWMLGQDMDEYLFKAVRATL